MEKYLKELLNKNKTIIIPQLGAISITPPFTDKFSFDESLKRTIKWYIDNPNWLN